ncbi:MAG: hypothetical protein LBU62_09905 [Bacteroidales bacterium]|jgi:hypothetical protein|nr:hypothetical protein [Bacteroidales bacterium]
MHRNRFFIIAICLFAPAFNIFAQDLYSFRGFESPVCVVQYGGYYYLSNAGAGLTGKDGDGYISRVKSDGSQEEVTMKYIAGLDSPHGIAASQGILYICDVDRLLGFDLQNKKKVLDLSFAAEKTQQLSGIAFTDNNTLYVSATDINAIFQVDLSGKKYRLWTESTAPNSLLIEKEKMYVSSWGTDSLPNGKISVIDMKKPSYKQIEGCEGYLRGLALAGNKLYFGDWVDVKNKRGVIRWHRLDTGENGEMKFTEKMGGPAEFIYDSRNNLFIVPAVLEGKVYGAMGFKP